MYESFFFSVIIIDRYIILIIHIRNQMQILNSLYYNEGKHNMARGISTAQLATLVD